MHQCYVTNIQWNFTTNRKKMQEQTILLLRRKLQISSHTSRASAPVLVQGGPETSAKLLVCLGKVAHRPLLDEILGVLEVASDVLHQAILLCWTQHIIPEKANL